MTDTAAARKALVCVIGGQPTQRAAICRALTSFYNVIEFSDPAAALAEMATTPPAAILVDEDVEFSCGMEVIRKIRRNDRLAGTPMVCMSHATGSTLFRDAVRQSGAALLVAPFRRGVLIAAISEQVNKGVESRWQTFEPVQRDALTRTVGMFNSISDLIDEGKPLPYKTLCHGCAPLVEAVASNRYQDILKGVKGHDNYSYVHSLRVATFLSLFGHTIGIRGSDLEMLATGGLVHDIGKVSIPLDVLNKPGKLVGEEWETMKSHVTLTSSVLRRNADTPKGVLTIAEQHHEKLDGSGYPKQLKGSELNDLARMATIVDIFGALTDRRVYKKAMSPEAALALMGDMTREIDQRFLKLFRSLLLDAALAIDAD